MSNHSSFDDYQSFTESTAIYPGSGTGSHEAMTYCALKLGGETGEFLEKLGKMVRKGKSIGAIDVASIDDDVKLLLAKELGDVLWYVAALARELEFPLSKIAEINTSKLSSRKERGVIDGSGDER